MVGAKLFPRTMKKYSGGKKNEFLKKRERQQTIETLKRIEKELTERRGRKKKGREKRRRRTGHTCTVMHTCTREQAHNS